MGAPRPYGQLQLLNIGAERKRLDAERRRCLRLMRDGRRCQRVKQSVESEWCGECRHVLARSSWRSTRPDDERRRCLRLLLSGRRCQRLKHSEDADWCGACRYELARSSGRKREFSKPKPVRRPIVAGSVRHLWLAAMAKARPVIRPEIREKVRALWERSVAGADAPGEATS